MKYEEMLKRGRDRIPETLIETARFEVPKIRGHIQGNKTIVTNLVAIADTLRRPPEHLLKYILKELATPGEFKKNLVIFGRKIPASSINEKIQQYTSDFVICRECMKPDTELLREHNLSFVHCLACGAKHIVKAKI